MKIELVGKYNNLELGTVEEGVYTETGLLADDAHRWKILAWINENLKDGIKVVKN
jgi:hypothetical protein